MSDVQRRDEILVTSILGMKTREPMVNITYGAKDVHLQLIAEDAIQLALDILAVANGAITDAFLVHFLESKAGIEHQHALGLLVEFREYREGRTAANDV